MSDLPQGWAWATLGEIAETIRGVTYKKAEARSEPRSGLLPLLRATNIVGGRLDLDSELVYVPSSRVSESQRLTVGDIVIAASSGSRSVVGKSAPLVREWPGTFGAFCSVARPRPAIDASYVGHFVASETVRRRWSSLATGTNINNLKRDHLTETPVPVPPLNEQRRVVAAIEEHLSRLDAADASLAAALRRVDALRKAALTAWYPNSVPDHWTLSVVGAVGQVALGRQRSPRYHSGPNMRPYLRVANVFEDRLDLSDVMTMDFPSPDFAKYKLEPGDILLNEGQSPHLVGRAAMFRGELDDVCFTNSLIRFRPAPEVDGDYALLVFRRHMHSGRFMREARITTNIAHLSAGRLKGVEFPVPPLEEQRRIVQEVEERLSRIDALRASIERAQRRSRTLCAAILERAFSGELVPQDPADEPAETLLARIRAERGA